MSASVTAEVLDYNSRPRPARFAWMARAMAFAVPLLGLIDIPVVGHLLASDIAMVVFVPFLFGLSLKTPLPRVMAGVLVFTVEWLFIQIVSDYLNHSGADDYMRVWAKIFLTGLYFVFFWRLYETDKKTLVWSAYGLGLFFLMNALSIKDYGLAARFGGALGLSIVTIGILTRDAVVKTWSFKWRLGAIILTLGTAAASLAVGARSAAIPLVACGFFGIANEILFGRRQPQWRGRLAIVLILCAGLYSTYYVYNVVSAEGMLGESNKYRTLSQGNYEDISPLRVLIGARPESLVAVQAIWDRPFIGHGSWAKDPHYVELIRRYSQFFTYGQDVQSLQAGGYLIPSHSYITGAMVDGGIFAGLFWIFTIIVIVKRMFLRTWPISCYPAIIYCGVELLYCIFFSPYGQGTRITAAIYFGILVTLTQAPPAPAPAAMGERRPGRTLYAQ